MTVKGRLAVIALVLLCAIPASARDRAGFYTGLRLVGSVAEVTDVNTTGFNGSLNSQNDNDLVGGGGGVFGYRWGRMPFRTELEIAHRVRFDWDTRDTGGASAATGYENNLESTNVLLNILFEYRNMSSITPFLGGTVGWARNRSETTRTNLGNGAQENLSNTVNNIAWGVMLGVDWAFSQRWTAEAAYRYINLGEANTGTFSAGDSLETENYVSHDVLLSVMFRW